MELIIGLGITAILLGLGFFVGGAAEKSHFRRLESREQDTSDFFVTQLKTFPGIASGGQPPQVFFGEAVIASDYLKNFLGSLRNLFGGEMGVYQRLLERSRREATLRVIEQARAAGYNAVCNVRVETADIGGNSSTTGNKGMVMAPIFVTATAYQRA